VLAFIKSAKNITRGSRFAIIFHRALGRAKSAFNAAHQSYFELSGGHFMPSGLWLAEARIGDANAG
jgi:hypothetical protein